MRLRNFFSRNEIKVLLVIFTLLVLIKIIISFFIPYPVYLTDERQYFEMGKSFIRTGDFLFEGKPWNHYPPLYPIVISPLTLFEVTTSTRLIKIMNAFLSSTIIFPVFLLTREFLSRRKAVVISILVSLIPENFVYTFTMMNESLLYPLFLTSVYFLYKSFTEKDEKWDILSGIAIAFTILTKMTGLVLFMGIPIIMFFKNPKKIIQSILDKWLLFFFTILLITPWFLRSVILFGLSSESVTGYGYFGNLLNNISSNLLFFGISHIAYLVFASGILFFSLTFFLTNYIRNKKLSTLLIITWILFFLLIFVTTFWSQFSEPGPGEKMFGRYPAPVISLLMVTGGIGLEAYNHKKNDKKLLLLLTLTSILLLFLPINKLIFSFDTPSTAILYIPLQLYRIGVLPFQPNMLITSMLVLTPFVFYVGKKYLTWDHVVPMFLLFFVLSSAVATYSIRVGSYDAEEYMEFGKWINTNIPKNSVILFERLSSDPENHLFWASEGVKLFSENKVITGDPSISKDADYLVSNRKMNLPLIFSFEGVEGVFNPQKETVYLYKLKQ